MRKKRQITPKVQTKRFDIRRVAVLVFSIFFLISSFLIWLFLTQKKVEAGWYDTNYAYRQLITIPNTGSADSNKKVKFDIDTSNSTGLISQGKMQSDCDDIRFTDINGKLLQYYLDTAIAGCNNASSDYYVLIPTINAGNTNIYMYYGNPTAVSNGQIEQFSQSTFSPTSSVTYATEENGAAPLLYWKFDDGQGDTTQDSSVFDNDGTRGGTTKPSWEPFGKIDQIGKFTLKFDGSTSKVTKSYSSDTELNPSTASFSVSAWFRHSSNFSGTDTLISRFSGAGYKIYMHSTDGLCFGIDDDSTFNPDDKACTTTSYADSQWHFLEAVRDTSSTKIILYVDGQSVAQTTTTVASTLNGSNPTFAVGIDSDGSSNPWDGFIDEVKYYNYARSISQVKTEFVAKTSVKGVSASFGQTDPKNSLTNGLVAYWKMDDTSWTDSSGNTNTGTTSGGTTTAAGKFGLAASFDGTDDYISVANSTSLAMSSSITMSAWVKPTATDSTRDIFAKQNSGDYWMLRINSGEWQCIVNSGGDFSDPGSVITNSTAAVASTWQHVACTFDGKTVAIYVNGELKRTNSYTGSISTNSGGLRIGVNGSSNQDFSGSIDEARLYNRALSPSEITHLYEFSPGPIAYYTFDEGTGSSALDTSGNGYNGSWVGTGTHYASGKIGKAATFNGTDDYINVTASGANVSSQYGSVSMWVYPQNTGAYDFFAAGTGGNDFRMTPGNNLYGFFISAEYRVSYGTDPPSNTWTYVTLTWDQTNGSILYYNGVKVASNSSLPPTFNQTGFKIGANPSGGELLQGLMDEVKVYNYPLSTKQIIQDMNAGHAPVGSKTPIVYMKFDEGVDNTCSGGTNDVCNSGSYGSTLDGTESGMSIPATSTSGWTTNGKFGRALNYDGTDDYVSIPDNDAIDFPNSQNFAVSFWIKDGSGNANGDSIVEKWSGTGGYPYSFRYTTGNSIAFRRYDGTNNPVATGTRAINDSLWHHIMGVRVDSTIKLYIDGILQDSQTDSTSGDTTNGSALFLGRRGASNYYAGTIDELKIYNYSLNESEMKLEYNQGKSAVMGATYVDSTGSPNYAASKEYCVPGDSTSCSSPVGEWKLDEGAGSTTYDTSGNGNTATFASTASWTSGKKGKAVNLNGTSDYVNLGHPSAINLANTFSISAWVRATSSVAGSGIITETFAGGADRVQYGLGFGLDDGTDNKLQVGFYDGSGWAIAEDSTAFTQDLWTHVEGTWDGTTLKLYKNGTQVATNTPGRSTAADTEDIRIGARHDTAGTVDFFPGAIDDVRIFDYVRSPAQVAWEYNHGDPVGWWKMDECTGTIAYDSSINSNNGTLTPGSGTNTSAGTCSSGSTSEMRYKGRNGKLNSALDFDGTDDYVKVTQNSAINVGDDFTLSLWVNTTDANGAFRSIISKDIAGCGSAADWFIDIENGAPIFWVGTPCTAITSSKRIDDGSWHHVVARRIRSNGAMTLFVDGIQKASGSSGTGSLSNSTDLLIGSLSGTDNFFIGKIDDVRVYNYALSDIQIQLLYNNNSAVLFTPITGIP